MNTKFLTLLIPLMLAIACNKDDDDELTSTGPQLPAETQTGANTFGCLVNGNLFYPRDGNGSVGSNAKAVRLLADTSPSGYEYYIELDVNNFQDGKPVNNFIMHLQNIYQKGVGEYIWKQSNFNHLVDGLDDNYLYVRAFDYTSQSWKWYGSYDNSGKTTITKYGNGIISGTFSGKLKEKNGTAEIEIAQGRFDFSGNTLGQTSFP